MLPLIALAAPLIGGAMSLAGGAMSMTGGVMAAGSTMAGIAADAASGVIGAASRLTGGGKSAPEPQAEARAPADQSTSDEQGAKALPPGVKLNKNGVMIQDSGGPGGGRILPGQFGEDGQLKSMDERLDSVTADRSGASPVNQILDYVKVIAANTARTAMGIGALMQQSAASTAQDNIEGAKPEPEPPEAKQGMVSKVFGGLRDRMKKINDSLGGVAKFMLKGLGLAGLIYLFKTNEESITKVVAGIFKFFHNLYKSFDESDDPMGDLMTFLKEKLKDYGNTLVEMFKGFYKETIEPMLVEMMSYINNFIEGILFGPKGDEAVSKETSSFFGGGEELDALSAANPGKNMGYAGSTRDGDFETTDASGEGNKLDAATRAKTTAAAKKRWNSMYNISRASDWAIQWTGVPFMNAGFGNWDLLESDTNGPLSVRNRLAISALQSTQPIVNGEILPVEALRNRKLLSEALGLTMGMSDDQRTGVLENAAMASSARWIQQNYELGTNSGAQLSGIMNFDDSVASGTLPGVANALTTVSPGLYNYDKFIEGMNTSSTNEFQAMPVSERLDLLRAEALFYEKASTDSPNSSIFTHDNTMHRLLEPISKAFENGTGNGTVIVDSSSNDNRMTKQGDTINMGLDAHHSDSTARAFHQWYHA